MDTARYSPDRLRESMPPTPPSPTRMRVPLPERVAARHLLGGILEPPPAMVTSIMDWLGQVLVARAIIRLEKEQADARSVQAEREDEYQRVLDVIAAMRAAPTNWKVYKTFQETLGWQYAGDLPFKSFTKLDAERSEALRVRVLQLVAKSEERFHELLAHVQGAAQGYQRSIDEMWAKITDNSTLSGPPGKRSITGIRDFPVDTTGWRYEAGIKDRIEARIRAELEPMITILRQQDNDVARDILKDFEGHWRNARHSYGMVHVDAQGFVPKGGAATWQARGAWLTVRMPDYYTEDTLLNLERAVQHELRHFAQSYLSHMTGHLDKAMGVLDKRIPQPGMPSRHIMTPEVLQHHNSEHWQGRAMPAEVARGMQHLRQQGIYPSEVHSLDDIEFYTDLADAVDDFRKMMRWHPEWTPANLRTAIKLYTFEMLPPRDTADWEPYGGWKMFSGVQGNKYFIALRKHAMPKWRKAVGEFIKAVG